MVDNVKNIAVVFGLGPAGLALSRVLSRAGRDVYAVCRPDDIGKYSNSLRGCIVAKEAGDVLRYLASLASCAEHHGKPECWIASDQYLTMILDNRSEFEDIVAFAKPGLDFFSEFNDKELAFARCREAGVNVPERATLNAVMAGEAEISFPLVVKPRVKSLFAVDDGVGKIRIVENRAELEDVAGGIVACGASTAAYECEPYIVGNNWNEIGYGGYAANGVMLADIAVRQFKQYPQGVACAAIEVTDPALLRRVRGESRKLVEANGYTGFIQFDIKVDETSGAHYVLDVNPRPWGSVGVLLRKYPSLARCISDGCPAVSRGKPLYWHSPLKEILAKGNASNAAIDAYAKKGFARVLDLWDAADPKPFLVQPIIGLEKVVSKSKRAGR